MHTHQSSCTSGQISHQMILFSLIFQTINPLVLKFVQKIRKEYTLRFMSGSAQPLKMPQFVLVSFCQRRLIQKKVVLFEKKDTLIRRVRDRAASSHYGIFSNAITRPQTKIFRLYNGAMKSCSTMHNCSL